MENGTGLSQMQILQYATVLYLLMKFIKIFPKQ